MIPYTDYTVRLGDLKRAIVENPYDPNLNIDGYMRYLKYNTPSAQPEIIRCKDCKYNLNNDRLFADPDPILTYAWCNTEAFQENDFCSKGKKREE